MTKPTEGPFELMVGQDHAEIVTSAGATVAVFWSGDPISFDEALANARRFIAAEKALAVLRSLILWDEYGMNDGPEEPNLYDDILPEARAALKEATGE